MEYTSAGAESHGKRWREYVTYKTTITSADGSSTSVWRKKTRVSEETTQKKAVKSAEVWRTELNAELADSASRGESAVRSGDKTVADYVDSFVDRLEDTKSIEPSTVTGYRTSARRIRRGLPMVVVRDLARPQVQEWVTSLSVSGLSSSTVIKDFRLLSQAMKDAVSMRARDTNPANGVRLPKRTKVHEGNNALDAEGRAALLDALDALEDTPTTVAARISLYTGLREGEICGLQWRDIDTKGGTLWVRRSIGTGKGGSFVKRPKTGRDRDVALPPSLIAYLSRWHEKQSETLGEDPASDAYVIGTQDEYTNPSYVSKTWGMLNRCVLNLRGSEGRAVTFHDLRHTWATLYISAGGDVKTAASNLGHANAAMTLNTYASSDREAKRRAAELTEAAMRPQTEGSESVRDEESEDRS